MKYIGLYILLAIAGCDGNSGKSGVQVAKEALVAPAAEPQSDQVIVRKLIKEGRVVFQTDDLGSTRNVIFEAVDNYKAYVSSDREFSSPDRKSNTVIIRVPAENFDNLLQEATRGVEKFDNKEIDVKDVTEEFLDIEARLKTKKELENRYLDLLKQAGNVTEILAIEKQIGQLRSEIESIEGRLEYLQNKVAFSTLTLTFYERIPHQTEFAGKFKNGFRNGWDNLIWFFVMLVNIWPFIIIVIALIFGIRFYRKRK